MRYLSVYNAYRVKNGLRVLTEIEEEEEKKFIKNARANKAAKKVINQANLTYRRTRQESVVGTRNASMVGGRKGGR